MRASRFHSWFPRLFAVLLGLALLPWLGMALLLAQDSTAVTDKTGILGPIIDKFFPVVVTFLTSLTVKIIAKANDTFAKTSEPVKWVALYAFALGYNLLAGWLGLSPVDAVAPAFGLAMVQGTAAAMVYKLAGRSEPAR